MPPHRQRVAVLGAGFAGSSIAVLLARDGLNVTLFDTHDRPMQGASRWNEGRVHLGYVYGADTTLRTARRMLDGAVRFRPVVEELLGTDLQPHCTETLDSYLVHRRSVIAPGPLGRNLDAINDLVRHHPASADYLSDARHAPVEPMTEAELRGLTDSADILAGFRVMERSVDTLWLSDALADVVLATPGLTFRPGSTVARAEPMDGRWSVTLDDGTREPFDIVVNASWNSLIEIDRTAGLVPEHRWSHRYRASLFVRTSRDVAVGSQFVTVGPFGILKNHGNRVFYLSWYETGLRSYTEGDRAILPAPMSPAEEAEFVSATREALVHLMPTVAQIFEAAETIDVRGGFVLAMGTGDIGDVASTLHQRDKFGVRQRGGYFSVDTGKFSTAPVVAERVVEAITGRDRRALAGVA